jgi:hypothetical protein
MLDVIDYFTIIFSVIVSITYAIFLYLLYRYQERKENIIRWKGVIEAIDNEEKSHKSFYPPEYLKEAKVALEKILNAQKKEPLFGKEPFSVQQDNIKNNSQEDPLEKSYNRYITIFIAVISCYIFISGTLIAVETSIENSENSQGIKNSQDANTEYLSAKSDVDEDRTLLIQASINIHLYNTDPNDTYLEVASYLLQSTKMAYKGYISDDDIYNYCYHYTINIAQRFNAIYEKYVNDSFVTYYHLSNESTIHFNNSYKAGIKANMYLLSTMMLTISLLLSTILSNLSSKKWETRMFICIYIIFIIWLIVFNSTPFLF